MGGGWGVTCGFVFTEVILDCTLLLKALFLFSSIGRLSSLTNLLRYLLALLAGNILTLLARNILTLLLGNILTLLAGNIVTLLPRNILTLLTGNTLAFLPWDLSGHVVALLARNI